MFFSKQNINWIKYGRLIEAKRSTINGNEYFIEVAIFNSYQEVLSKTLKVVEDVSNYAEILEKKLTYTIGQALLYVSQK